MLMDTELKAVFIVFLQHWLCVQTSCYRGAFATIGLFRYIKIQLDSESVRTKTKESG